MKSDDGVCAWTEESPASTGRAASARRNMITRDQLLHRWSWYSFIRTHYTHSQHQGSWQLTAHGSPHHPYDTPSRVSSVPIWVAESTGTLEKEFSPAYLRFIAIRILWASARQVAHRYGGFVSASRIERRHEPAEPKWRGVHINISKRTEWSGQDERGASEPFRLPRSTIETGGDRIQNTMRRCNPDARVESKDRESSLYPRHLSECWTCLPRGRSHYGRLRRLNFDCGEIQVGACQLLWSR